MNTRNPFEGRPGPQDEFTALAFWLQNILAISPLQGESEMETAQIPIGEDVSLLKKNYHPLFYPQIPDFALALLKKDPEATTRYAPLLFHLIGCPACHQAYLETYDALRAALYPEDGQMTIPLSTHSPANAATIPPKMQVFLCQLLIGQARAILQQAHREHTDQDAWARSLLQQAIEASKHILQSAMRLRALRDLVEVATLYNTATGMTEPGPPTHAYSPLVGAGSGTRGKVLRRTEVLQRPAGQPVIFLQAGALEGFITQHGEMLELHLDGLEELLRGHRVLIRVPLGSLLEPVRWLGGNPSAIRSSEPVGPDGKLVMPLGRTDLQLSNPEERNLLETLFKKLEVRPAD